MKPACEGGFFVFLIYFVILVKRINFIFKHKMIIINHIDFILYFCYNLFNLQLNIDNLYK